jgi:hypothetical protein
MPALAPTPYWLVDTLIEPAERIRRDFNVLPGLALTHAQARRLWGLGEVACKELLNALVRDEFLHLRADARYVMRKVARRPAPGSAPPGVRQ